jgi:hypothetical protein
MRADREIGCDVPSIAAVSMSAAAVRQRIKLAARSVWCGAELLWWVARWNVRS